METSDEREKIEAFYRELDEMSLKTNDSNINYRESVFFDNGTPYVTLHVNTIMDVYEKHFYS